MAQSIYGDPGAVSDAIRVVTVTKQASGGSSIDCSPRTVSLSAIEDAFIAISHPWGKSEALYSILVNGHHLDIHPNLWQFLLCAADRLPVEQLWIDAICINQMDVEDK